MTPLAAVVTGAVMTVTGATGTTASGHAFGCATITHTLAVGSRGEDVKQVQALLDVQQTGYFGLITRERLVVWQIEHKVITSALASGAGQIGPKTRAALSCANDQYDAALPVGLKIFVSTSTAASSTLAATTTPTTIPVMNMTLMPSGGGSGPQCTPLPPKPSANSCDTGPWEVYPDEAGCDVWACTSTDDRG